MSAMFNFINCLFLSMSRGCQCGVDKIDRAINDSFLEINYSLLINTFDVLCLSFRKNEKNEINVEEITQSRILAGVRGILAV